MSAGRDKGEQGEEFLLGAAGEGNALPALIPAFFEKAQAHRQIEQLLKGQPPPGQSQSLLILREVDVFDGELHRRQPVGLTDGLGQGFGQAPGAVQGLLGQGGQQVVADPRRQPVDRHDATGEALFSHPLEDGVDHSAAAALDLHRPIKDILLPRPDRPLHIALVEEGEVEGGGVVHHLHLDQLQPLPDAGQPGVLRGHGVHAYPALQRGVSDGVQLPPVLVVPGVPGQQIAGGGQSQFFQLLGPDLSHPRKRVHRRAPRNGHSGAPLPDQQIFLLYHSFLGE